MSLNNILERVRLIDAPASEEIQEIHQTGTIDDQEGQILAQLEQLDAVTQVQPDRESWARLIALFAARADVHAKRGEVEEAQQAFRRAAIYGLLIGDAQLREQSLQAAENAASIVDSASAAEGATDLEAEEAVPKHAAPDQSEQRTWATAAELTELEPEEFGDSINELAGLDDPTATQLIKDCYDTLSAQLTQATKENNADRQIQIADRVIVGANSSVHPTPELLSNCVFTKSVALAQRGYSPQLESAVDEAINVFSSSSDHDTAGETLMLCYRALIPVPEASAQRFRLLSAASGHYEESQNTPQSLTCQIELGMEHQRTNNFADAFTFFQNAAQQSYNAQVPATFTRASFLVGDSWGRAIQERKVEPNKGAFNAARAYISAISTFPEEQYTTNADKQILALANLRLAVLLHSKRDLAQHLQTTARTYALKAHSIFESLGENERAQQCLQYQ